MVTISRTIGYAIYLKHQRFFPNRHGRSAKAKTSIGVHGKSFLLVGFTRPSQESSLMVCRAGVGGQQEGRVLVVTTESSPLVKSERKCVVSHMEAERLAYLRSPASI